MPQPRALFFAGTVILAGAPSVVALEEVSGLNLSADESFGARRSGFALTHAGFQNGADGAVNAPASMNDADDFAFSAMHAERFGAARFDCASMLVPLQSNSTLGLGVSRYAVGGIESRSAVSPGTSPAGEPDGLFSVADWLVSGAFARRFGALDVGAVFHLLYRQLDQNGLGMRADAMAQYTFDGRYRLGAFVRGLLPSLARWESGRSEYEPSDASVFAAGRWELPYFYGKLQAGWETQGLFQPGGKSANGLDGNRGSVHPMTLFKTSSLGAEFRFDFGFFLRAGLQEVDLSHASSALRLGTGYDWHGILGVDYAFSPHPLLGDGHRLALQFTPSFPRFQGRNFRSRIGNPPYRKPVSAAPATIPSSGESHAPEAEPASAPPSPAKEILEEE